jgi:hypothetical protein
LAEELELETQLAMATAEENAYLEAEKTETTILQQRSDKPTLRHKENTMFAYEAMPQMLSTEVRKRNADVVPDKNLEATRKQRDDDNAQFERFLQTQKQSANSLMLPKPEVPVFSGDPIDYQTFIRAFENLIEANTDSNSARLCYLSAGLLIGCDVPEVLEPIEIRRSKDGGPYATKTIFGWVVNGPLGRNSSTEHIANYLQATDANLENQLKNFATWNSLKRKIQTKLRYRERTNEHYK